MFMLAALFMQPEQANAACSGPSGKAGEIIYNQSQNVFQYCNDTDWIAMGKPGSGSGGCANPAIPEGQMGYNADHRVLQGCAGNVHVAMGPVGGNNQKGGWKAISAGYRATCGIRMDDSGWCWGTGWVLGNGSADEKDTPTIIPGGDNWKKIAAGDVHACGIKSDDTLWCWGADNAEQLGDGAGNIHQLSPVAVAGGGTWKDISTGYEFSCAIKSDDTLYCWGDDTSGKLGNGAVAGTQASPYQVSAVDTWKQVRVNQRHACAIKTDDTLWCWGLDTSGELGNGATGSTTSPGAVTGGHTWKQVAVGANHTCAIKMDDTMWCWGSDYYGGVGTGGGEADPAQQNPVTVSGGGTWRAVAAGAYSSCGIKTDNSLWCWGRDNTGQQANGNGGDQYIPTAISGGGSWSSISSEQNHVCAIRTNGNVLCWGRDENGQLGNGASNEMYKTAPSLVPGGQTWKDLSGAGSDQFSSQTGHSCAIQADDTISCWGANIFAQLGIGSTGGYRDTPSSLSGGGAWKQVATGFSHSCGIKTDDTAWCWGDDSTGQLGNGATAGTQTAPSAVSGGDTWKKLTASSSYMTCGIKTNDTLWCWGADTTGQLGNGAIAGNQISPVQIDGGGTWKDVVASHQAGCGIKSDDTLWCWGSDSAGQLGNGAAITGDQISPTIVTGGSTWRSVTIGNGFTCGVKMDETAWCWGDDIQGQLGNGATTGNQVDPVPVSGGYLWKSLSSSRGANQRITCGIQKDDTLWCWGYDDLGTLGNGAITGIQESPFPVQGGGTWKKISVAGSTACALSTNGQLYCWGFAGVGQLANGESINAQTPGATLCGSPSGKPGAIAYNSASNVLQYCDGNGWVAIVASHNTAGPCPNAGDTCPDGTIYAGASSGNRLYVTAADNSASSNWNAGNNNGVAFTTTGATSVSDGQANAAVLLVTDSDSVTGGTQTHNAAQLCADLVANGKSDWYLPATDELNTLYSNRATIGGFAGTYYWTSREGNNNSAYAVNFSDGSVVFYNYKDGSLRVRCVRK